MAEIEILGYVATIIVAISFLMKDVLKLRCVNSIGCLCFVLYGVLIGAIPVALLNGLIVAINAYYILSGLRAKQAS